MNRFYLLIVVFSSSIETACAGDLPFNFFNVNFGIGNYKSPLIYTYSLEYSRDINLSKRSSFLIGLEWENFYQKEKYDVDTNFIGVINPATGGYNIKYYNYIEKVMVINLALAYKYWLKKSKSSSIYLQTEINFNFIVREVNKAESYYRDTNQTLYLGPYSYSHKDNDDSKPWILDNISPALSFGYLKNINKNLAYHFKFDLVIPLYDLAPYDLARLYPKLGFGLAFR